MWLQLVSVRRLTLPHHHHREQLQGSGQLCPDLSQPHAASSGHSNQMTARNLTLPPLCAGGGHQLSAAASHVVPDWAPLFPVLILSLSPSALSIRQPCPVKPRDLQQVPSLFGASVWSPVKMDAESLFKLQTDATKPSI